MHIVNNFIVTAMTQIYTYKFTQILFHGSNRNTFTDQHITAN